MSGIAGVYQFDGRPVDPALLARMTRKLSHRGPDGDGRWVGGPVGLGHRLLASTSEARKEQQPVTDPLGECYLVWDGRVDNRDDLVSKLRMARVTAGGETDPDLMLAAFRTWGPACLTWIIGEFAFAVWDSRRRRLFCARDAIGVKPFYYHCDGRRLTFASECQALFQDPSIEKRPNDFTIADYLLMGFRDAEATFFAGIKQLPPSHLMTVADGRVTLQRFFDFEAVDASRYPNDADYSDRFQEVFRQAVRCRLRSSSPVGILLSGGIDSTGVTAMAASIHRSEGGHPAITALTLSHQITIEEEEALQWLPHHDGVRYQRVAAACGDTPVTEFELFATIVDMLHYDGFFTVPQTLRAARDNHLTTLLTGFGSDELFQSGEDGFLEDLLRHGRLQRLHVELDRLCEAYGATRSAYLLELVLAQVPRPVIRMLKRWSRRHPPSWINSDFAKKVDLRSWTPSQPARRFRTRCQEKIYRRVTAPCLGEALNYLDASCSAYGLECRHPFLDRRVVEFLIGVPGHIQTQGGYRKMFFQRSVLHNLVGRIRPREGPAPNRGRDEMHRDTHWLDRTLFRADAQVFRYIDRGQVERMRDRYLAGDLRQWSRLWQFSNLERWLHAQFPGSLSA